MRRGFGIALLILVVSMTSAAVASCTMSTPGGVAFGNYTGVRDRVTVIITVTCQYLSSYSISLNAGQGSGATLTTRTMTGPSAPALAYGLYSDSGYSSNWGAGGTAVQCGGFNFGGCTYYVTVYGQVGATQLIVPGGFADTITASSTGSASISIPISATFLSYCLVPTTTALNFGTYKGAQLDSTATISITCSNTTSYYVNLSDGANWGSGWQNNMKGTPGGMLLPYTLYRTSDRTGNKWGNTYNYDGVAGIGIGSAQTLTVYGRLFGGYYPTPGSYSDAVVATLTY